MIWMEDDGCVSIYGALQSRAGFGFLCKIFTGLFIDLALFSLIQQPLYLN